MDEVAVSIAGKKHWLWRAPDQGGFVLDVLVQSRRDRTAAQRLMLKLLKKTAPAPRVMIADKLRSTAAGGIGPCREGLRMMGAAIGGRLMFGARKWKRLAVWSRPQPNVNVTAPAQLLAVRSLGAGRGGP